MNKIAILNPDDFLGTPRVWTPERNRNAWEEIYSILERNFSQDVADTTLYMVFGIQGSGKSTFIKNNPDFFSAHAFVVDAALPAARHRQRALTLAKQHGVRAEAVWIDTPLRVALSRNSLREPDQQVPMENIVNVHTLLEAPTSEEGFSRIHRIRENP
ncbi:AAA family ATPase [Janthinobacterium sp. PC23-8]|uniref:AAA family ATPase n=1 Tax=Janthinobacterium sp. PC23-8 TaxID=2012679 RepID=UPI00114067DF|nr:AAA family ATPase [Janthinobacterium sp. PC23-8]